MVSERVQHRLRNGKLQPTLLSDGARVTPVYLEAQKSRSLRAWNRSELLVRVDAFNPATLLWPGLVTISLLQRGKLRLRETQNQPVAESGLLSPVWLRRGPHPSHWPPTVSLLFTGNARRGSRGRSCGQVCVHSSRSQRSQGSHLLPSGEGTGEACSSLSAQGWAVGRWAGGGDLGRVLPVPGHRLGSETLLGSHTWGRF